MKSANITVITRQNLFLVFFSIIFFSLSVPFTYPGLDIDASWHEALVMAIDNHFVFGHDFIFNYGPLGYMNTGLLPKSVSPAVLVCSSIFELLNYLVIMRLAFNNAGKNWWIVAISAVIILVPWGFIADRSFTLFYFLLFWLLYAQQSRNTFGLILSVLLSVLIFFIKVNLSIVVYVVLYASLIYFCIARYFKLRTIIIIAALQITLTWSLSFLFHVDIPAYLGASLKIIDAYQDAMAVMVLSTKELLSLLFFETLILITAGLFILRSFQWQSVYLYLLVALSWFLIFKQAHTAIAHYNIFGFFLFMPPLAVLLYLFSADKHKKWAGRAFILILALQLAATQFIRFYMGGHTLKGYILTYPPNSVVHEMQKDYDPMHILDIIRLKNPGSYIKRLVQYNYNNNFKNIPARLPEDLLQKIGKASVDIVPYHISYLYFNQLNYNPRPVIQSYQANSAWLMKKNGEKYFSKTAPEFVLFKLEAFREQNPFWVETDLTKALLTNYRLIDTTFIDKDTFFVFQHQVNPKKLKTDTAKSITFKLDEDISLPVIDQPLVLTAEIKYSLKGKLARLFFQPPYLYCMVTYTDGKQENFRVIDKILKGGIFINPKVTTLEEAADFFLNQGKNNRKITKIRFWARYSSGFEEKFSGQIQTYTLP